MTTPTFPEKQGKLFIVIVGPSGAGKGTLMHELTRHDPRLKFFITATTRAPREGEYNGVHYAFLTPTEFAAKEAAGDFLETDDHYGNRYGTLRSIVEGHMAEGDDVITDLNWRGVAQIEEKMPDKLLKILIMPPSMEELVKRFEKRAKTSKESPEKQAERLAQIEHDLQHAFDESYIFENEDMAGSSKNDYHAVIINDDLDRAVHEVLGIIEERRKRD